MRVLVVHNHYRSALPSGENRVVLDEVEMLRDAGLEVETYFRSSDEIESFTPRQRLVLATRPIYSFEDSRAFRARIRAFRPDVVHLHNPFPLISPWVVRVAKQEGVPVVQTVHNYRHACPAGILFRDGRVCEECTGKAFPWPTVTHGCYRGSHAQSAVMATAQLVHRQTWQLVDRYLAISNYVAEHLVATGIPRERVTAKPNAVRDPGPPPPLGTGFLFAGRLDPEKGVRLLLDAWESSGIGSRSRLVIAGDGPERPWVEDAASRVPGIRYAGLVDREHLQHLIAETAVVVVPSTWNEPFGMLAVEAFALGRPVLATRVGGLAEIVDRSVGWVADPSRAPLARALGRAAGDDVGRLGAAARVRFALRYAQARVTAALIATYAEVSSTATLAGPRPVRPRIAV